MNPERDENLRRLVSPPGLQTAISPQVCYRPLNAATIS
jgi:hypothetical protein